MKATQTIFADSQRGGTVLYHKSGSSQCVCSHWQKLPACHLTLERSAQAASLQQLRVREPCVCVPARLRRSTPKAGGLLQQLLER